MPLSTVDITAAIVGLILGIVALVKVVIPAGMAVSRFFRKVSVALDIFGGRPEHTDEVTGKKVDEVPPLGTALKEIRSEQTLQGRAIQELTTGFQKLADQQAQINALRSDVDLLKAGTIERAAGKIENASLFDMIAKRDSDVVDGDVE